MPRLWLGEEISRFVVLIVAVMLAATVSPLVVSYIDELGRSAIAAGERVVVVEETLFFEDFEDGAFPAGWTCTFYNNATIVNGTLYLPATSTTYSRVICDPGTFFTLGQSWYVEYDIKPENQTAQTEFKFIWRNISDPTLLAYGFDARVKTHTGAGGVYSDTTSFAALKFYDETTTFFYIYTFSAPVVEGWTRVRIEYSGGEITMSLNGTTVLTANLQHDNDFRGMIFDALNAPAFFDNFHAVRFVESVERDELLLMLGRVIIDFGPVIWYGSLVGAVFAGIYSFARRFMK